MRSRKNWGSRLAVAAAIVCALMLLGVAVPGSPAPVPGPPPDPAAGVFTPAHPSAVDALLDFLSWRPTPVQPIAFPHKTHLANGLMCETCHMGVTQGPVAGIPDVRFCMSCHSVIAKDRPEIKKVAAYLARGEDIPWQRVYDYSQTAHVRFNHAPHIRAGVQCSSCHGDMTQQTTASRVVNLNMGYCLSCHKQRNVSIDCQTCHF
jgi:hypothetical protein